MSAAYLNVETLSGAAIVKIAARHNLREIQAELGAGSHINPAQTCRNMRLAGPETAAEIADLANNAMQDGGVGKLRKNAVRAIEILVSIPLTFDPATLKGFFVDALAWVRGFFGVPVLSAVVHLDEEQPHMHVLLLPLVNGKMDGSALVGDRKRLQEMQAGFFESVACRYGLSKPRPAKRLSRAIRVEAASVALACLHSHPDRLQLHSVRTALHEAVATNPEPMLAALGLEVPTGKAKAQKSFVQIMTKPCKPEPRPNPIGFDAPAVTPESKPYPCVGFANPPEHSAPAKPEETPPPAIVQPDDVPPCDASPGDYERVPDDVPGAWDEVRGEWVPLKTKRTGAARTWALNEHERLSNAVRGPVTAAEANSRHRF